MPRNLRLPTSYPAIDPDLLSITRRLITGLRHDGYKIVFPPGGWDGVPHFHARIPGTTSWAHVYIREEEDDRFLTRYNRDTSHREREAGRYV